MDTIEKLFADLESNNVARAEDSKKKLCETFSLTKEPWLINGMMEYFSQTNSSRVVDILVKIQAPHDKFIFDRLSEWIHSSNRNQAITLLGHIVKKHPSWLHKIASHPLLRDLLKLLKIETNIIPIMNALFCLIILLPIIPTSMPPYLNDLFDVFLYLATWNCQNLPRLTEDQLIHLQIGLSTYFQRLYGMFPCNFVSYLKEYVLTEHSNVFTHTIRPLLETVKMHPMLLTSNRDLEKSNIRWKEMEPHDVVVECSKFALDCSSNTEAFAQTNEGPYNRSHFGQSKSVTPISQQILRIKKSAPASENRLSSPFYLPFTDVGKPKEAQRIDNLWSPLMGISTPPPIIGGAPLTPTPTVTNYLVQPIPSGGNAPGQQSCISGSSPPEAAVEATPETTPLKDLNQMNRPFPVNSTAVRAIWGVSQPSSPLKNPVNNFCFTNDIANSEPSILSSPKIQSFVAERSSYATYPMIEDSIQNNMDSSETNNIPAEQQRRNNNLNDCLSTDWAPEDAEVTRINSAAQKTVVEPALRFKSSTNGNNVRSSVDQIDDDEDNTSTEEENDGKNGNAPELAGRIEPVQSKLLRCKRSNFAHHKDRISIGTQTLEQLPTYQHIFVDLAEYGDTNRAVNSLALHSVESADISNSPSVLDTAVAHRSAPLSPHTFFDQYIERTIKRNEPSSGESNNNRLELYRDQIQLLNLQLQFERYRREVHAERNRRLLGKSRVNAALEMDNEKLREQKDKLAAEVDEVSALLNKARVSRTQQEQDYVRECSRYQREVQLEREEKKQLKESIEVLQRNLVSEQQARRDLSAQLESVQAEMFDMRNELLQTQEKAEMGLRYKNELVRLQSEVVLMGEIQLKCKEKLSEVDACRARDVEAEGVRTAYAEEVKEMRCSLESKSTQLDSAKARLFELESQLSRRDSMFIEQKRLLKTVKEEYQDRFRTLEDKYKAQKAVILRMEEELLELFHKSQSASVNSNNVLMSEPEKGTGEYSIGSLDHTSPLSISLASSEGLSLSLRSTSTEIRNLHPLVSAPNSAPFNSTTQSTSLAAGVSNNRQPVSDDIPVPSSSQLHHIHPHNKH